MNPEKGQYEVLQTFHGEFGPKSSRRRRVEPSLGIAAPGEQDLRSYLAEGPAQAQATLEAAHVPGAKLAGKMFGAVDALGNLGVSLSAGGLNVDLGAQSYRFTEHCLLAERECNIIGTCVENPSPTSEHDRNMIRRGANEKTFLITTESESQIENSLRRRSLLLVVLGAAISIGMAAIALHLGGMF